MRLGFETAEVENTFYFSEEYIGWYDSIVLKLLCIVCNRLEKAVNLVKEAVCFQSSSQQFLPDVGVLQVLLQSLGHSVIIAKLEVLCRHRYLTCTQNRKGT